MLRLLLAAALAAWLTLLAPPGAVAAITAPTSLGHKVESAATVGSITITTTASAPAGTPIAVAIALAGTVSGLSITDSAGNTYTPSTALTYNGTGKIYMAYVANPVALGSGGTITVTWGGGTLVRCAIAAASLNGVTTTSPLDVTGAGQIGSAGSASVATGTLAQADEIVIGVTSRVGTPGAWTEASGFTTLPSHTPTSVTNIAWAYQIVSSTSSVTYAPSWANPGTYGANVYSFKAAAGGGSPRCGARLSLMGVGRC